MKRILYGGLLLATLLCLVSACRHTPKPLLSPERMIEIGMDLRLAEADLAARVPAGAGQDLIEAQTQNVYAPILAHYGLSLDEYQQNVHYYLGKPQKMQAIQDAIAERLRALADEPAAE
ncbi:MAG: DUF4296 domain-containing protein [Bacteroidales bacterium]|nr:DUF4296 domain-containing protein [Bacteroidales bacterium]